MTRAEIIAEVARIADELEEAFGDGDLQRSAETTLHDLRTLVGAA